MAYQTMLRTLYTVPQANDALTLIRGIVRDIRRLWKQGQKLLKRKQEVEADSSYDPYELSKVLEELSWAENDAVRLQREIEELGVEVRSIARGRVDFYSNYNQHLVYLSWQFGEEEVSRWRETNQPFIMRSEIEEENMEAFKNDFEGIEQSQRYAQTFELEHF